MNSEVIMTSKSVQVPSKLLPPLPDCCSGVRVSATDNNICLLEKPRFSSCLTDGLSNGASYFYLREDGILNSTCYVYGSPVPTLDCRTYDYANNEQAKLPLVTRNYTSLPLTNRMLFNSVKRGVAKVKCVADGGVTGKISTERNVRVDCKCMRALKLNLKAPLKRV